MTFKTTLMFKHKKITLSLLDLRLPTYRDRIMNNEGFDIVNLDKWKKLRAISFFKKKLKQV